MRVLDHSNLEQRLVEGIRGTMTALDLVGEEAFGVGLRVVPMNSKVPKPGMPWPRGRRILFVLRGAGTITNGEYYENITAGKFITLDDGEFPSFTTGDDELVLLEVRHQGAKQGLPPTVALTPPLPMETRATPVVARTTMYESV